MNRRSRAGPEVADRDEQVVNIKFAVAIAVFACAISNVIFIAVGEFAFVWNALAVGIMQGADKFVVNSLPASEGGQY